MPDPAAALPPLIFWRLPTGCVLRSVYGPLADVAEGRDKDGCKAQHICCRRSGRPAFAVAWRLRPEDPWQPMETCPVPEAAADAREGGEGRPQMSKYGR